MSQHEFDSSNNAKQKLRKANSNRTVFLENNKVATPSHVYDFIITFYWKASPTDNDVTKSKCSKVGKIDVFHIFKIIFILNGT